MLERKALGREVTKGWHRDEQRWLERFREVLATDYGDIAVEGEGISLL